MTTNNKLEKLVQEAEEREQHAHAHARKRYDASPELQQRVFNVFTECDMGGPDGSIVQTLGKEGRMVGGEEEDEEWSGMVRWRLRRHADSAR